jgi:hypothetical protein
MIVADHNDGKAAQFSKFSSYFSQDLLAFLEII